MTVFKTYFKVLKQNLGIIILYTVILVFFAAFNTANNDSIITFEASKPDIVIMNQDIESDITKNLNNYLKKHANIVKMDIDEEALSDALFYREINAILYIYDGYTEDYLNNQEKKLNVKFTTDYNSSYMKMLLDRYFKVADIANNNLKDQDEILTVINASVTKESVIEMKSKLDTDNLEKAAFYFTFANYSILGICIYIIAILLNTFNDINIKKRNLVSSKKISTLTKELYLSNLVFSLFIWLFVVILSFFIVGNIMFSIHGLLLILNCFLFTLVALGIGFLIGSIIKNKEGISGMVNVVALGSSFLCGSFLPVEFMPQAVLNFSRILPSYWYIQNNNFIKTIEVFHMNNLGTVIINMLVMICFVALFFGLTMFYNKKKSKI